MVGSGIQKMAGSGILCNISIRIQIGNIYYRDHGHRKGYEAVLADPIQIPDPDLT
jgi:hypothetical protein